MEAARDAYLAAWREELERVIGDAVEACVDQRPDQPSIFLASHIAEQAGIESFEELAATIKALQEELKRSKRSELLLSTRRSSTYSNASSSEFVQKLAAENPCQDNTTLEYLLQNYADPEDLPPLPDIWESTTSSRQGGTTLKVLQAVARLSGSRRRSATHPCIRVVGREHLPSTNWPNDAQLSQVLAIAQSMEKCEWDADLLTLCGILHHPMAFVVEVSDANGFGCAGQKS